ncbi:MAG: hypothetical protein INQ03_15345 [Candidatus Heimdallarchaeota archaeon]|nr:hypothetical protein [Candidatus Heimdallarchaeota archaeon]
MQYTSIKSYNPNSKTRIIPRNRIITVLQDSEEMLQYLEINCDHFEEILEVLNNLILEKVGNYKSSLINLSLDALVGRHLKTEYSVYESIIQLVCFVLELPEYYDFSLDDEYTITKISNIRAVMYARYYRIKTLIHVFGRKDGISMYKRYIKEMTKKPNENQNDTSIDELRREIIEEWATHEAMDYSVHSFDNDMFVARFDNCLNYDAIKDLDDNEIGYLTSCYHGPFMLQQSQKNLRMRRTVTLFNHSYCDELYWNKEVHNEPKQPSLHIIDKLVILE